MVASFAPEGIMFAGVLHVEVEFGLGLFHRGAFTGEFIGFHVASNAAVPLDPHGSSILYSLEFPSAVIPEHWGARKWDWWEGRTGTIRGGFRVQ